MRQVTLLRVHPSQLIPECIIVENVYGKTNQPIVPKKTVVKSIHIEVLKRFLISEVEVSAKLSNGQPFYPEPVVQNDPPETNKLKTTLPFLEHYDQVVDQYKTLFNQWQSGKMMNINDVRQLIVPLLERVDQAKPEVFLIANRSHEQDYLYHHSVATALITSLLAQRLGYEKESLQISLAALIADSGMAKLNHSLLEKKGRLNDQEFEEIKKHTTYSYRFIEKSPSLGKGAKLAILQHHERLDGSGYPFGVKEEKIHPFAKVVAIADAYHAMTAERLYQNKRPFFDAIINMFKLKFIQFDERMLDVFAVCIEESLLGKTIRLSNDQLAEIVFLELNQQTKLFVQLIENKEIIDLSQDYNLTIKSYD